MVIPAKSQKSEILIEFNYIYNGNIYSKLCSPRYYDWDSWINILDFTFLITFTDHYGRKGKRTWFISSDYT